MVNITNAIVYGVLRKCCSRFPTTFSNLKPTVLRGCGHSHSCVQGDEKQKVTGGGLAQRFRYQKNIAGGERLRR